MIASKPVIGEKAETPIAWCKRVGEIRKRFLSKSGSQTLSGIPCQILGMKKEYFRGLLGSALTMLSIATG